ncbi:MAG TPA: hypothetical protein VK733_00625 [Gemmatimonadaceae bacterium]|jgi:hypothetical protein|nr:hypothetical protein [Gemmatimonadaceae bacterium]
MMRGALKGALIGAVAGLACLAYLWHVYSYAIHHGATPAGAAYGPGELAWFLSVPFGLLTAYGIGSLACCGTGTPWHITVFAVVFLNFVVVGALAGAVFARLGT